MRILQVTNIISHHQLPLARCLASAPGDDNFRFAVTDPPMVERVKMGWDAEELESWLLSAGENETHRVEFEHWWDDADVVIAGYRNVSRIADRVRRGKLTFYMSERWWKPPIGIARLLHPRFAWMAYRFCRLAQSPLFHYLPMGRYAETDMRRITSFQGRMWDWGYFTDVHNPLPSYRDRDKRLRVIWAGRMLALKRVDTLVQAFSILMQQNPKARLTLIGDGPCRHELERLVQKLKLTGNVDIHSSMPVAQVRNQMRQAHVYVLPSNGYEGWGAVLNEAMSEGCAIVASEAAGAAKTMIRHGENGLLFAPGDYRRLGDMLVQLSRNESERLRLAEAGQKTISEYWSPNIAAERFLAVSDALLSKGVIPNYPTGPMSLLGQ
ncbi:MAG: glycosyltransferase family 4 protein [bacterium]